MRLFLKAVFGLGLTVRIAGIGIYFVTGPREKLLRYINFISALAGTRRSRRTRLKLRRWPSTFWFRENFADDSADLMVILGVLHEKR
jgi:hypothetical protein